MSCTFFGLKEIQQKCLKKLLRYALLLLHAYNLTALIVFHETRIKFILNHNNLTGLFCRDCLR